MNKNDTQLRWLSPKDFENIFGIKQSTQAKLRMNKMIPYSKIGKFIRYDIFQVNRWLEEHKIVGIN